MRIELDDLSRPQIHVLLNEHLRNMYEITPAASVHALDLARLRSPDITFWTVWEQSELVGCGALKELDRSHGEIKSMRTPQAARRKGAGRALLNHIISVARARGYRHLSLETGPKQTFMAAQSLYASAGFCFCRAFGDYRDEDPHSVFMTLSL